MHKLWIAVLLFCSVSVLATEKADFTLKWQEEPKRAVVPKKVDDLPGYLYENKTHKPDMFSRVDKANRLRVTDPNFSTYNSDGGSSAEFSIHH